MTKDDEIPAGVRMVAEAAERRYRSASPVSISLHSIIIDAIMADRTRRAPDAVVSVGRKIVPEKPTEEMIKAGEKEISEREKYSPGVRAGDVFGAMLTESPPAPQAAQGPDWRDDPSVDERWNAGLNYAMNLLCSIFKVDPKKVTWDAATETLDGDIRAVLCNILHAWSGDDWIGLPAVREMLLDGQGDDDGRRILPVFAEDDTVLVMVEACLHLLERRRDVIAGYAAKASDAAGAAVKPLEWEGDGHWSHGPDEGWMEEANTPFGWGYSVEFGHEGNFKIDSTFGWSQDGFESPNEAKAAAQADYEKRILSALATPPSQELQEAAAAVLQMQDGLPMMGNEAVARTERLRAALSRLGGSNDEAE